MFQLSTAVMLYNASLSYYYFMTVCRQVSKIEFAKKFHYEKICHVISIGYPLMTAILGLVLDLYDFSGGRCFISKVENAKFVLIFKGVISIVVCLWIIFTNVRIVLDMKKLEKGVQRYTSHLDVLRAKSTRGKGKRMRVLGATVRRKESMKQALLYSLSFFVTCIFVWIRFAMHPPNGDKFLEPLIIIPMLILFPLQGFWNLIIYAYPEIRRIKKYNQTMTFRQCLYVMIIAPDSLNRRRPSLIGTLEGQKSLRSSRLAAKMRQSLQKSSEQRHSSEALRRQSDEMLHCATLRPTQIGTGRNIVTNTPHACSRQAESDLAMCNTESQVTSKVPFPMETQDLNKVTFAFENDDIIYTSSRKIEEDDDDDNEEGVVEENEETSDGNSSSDMSFAKLMLHGENDDDSCWSYASES